MTNKNHSQNNSGADDMSFSIDIHNFGDTDIVSFPDSSAIHKFRKIKDAFKSVFRKGGNVESSLRNELQDGLKVSSREWFEQGVDCEILKVGGNDWQKGKIKLKVTMDFYPDDPEFDETLVSNQPGFSKLESPLDDIRRTMNS